MLLAFLLNAVEGDRHVVAFSRDLISTFQSDMFRMDTIQGARKALCDAKKLSMGLSLRAGSSPAADIFRYFAKYFIDKIVKSRQSYFTDIDILDKILVGYDRDEFYTIFKESFEQNEDVRLLQGLARIGSADEAAVLNLFKDLLVRGYDYDFISGHIRKSFGGVSSTAMTQRDRMLTQLARAIVPMTADIYDYKHCLSVASSSMRLFDTQSYLLASKIVDRLRDFDMFRDQNAFNFIADQIWSFMIEPDDSYAPGYSEHVGLVRETIGIILEKFPFNENIYRFLKGKRNPTTSMTDYIDTFVVGMAVDIAHCKGYTMDLVKDVLPRFLKVERSPDWIIEEGERFDALGMSLPLQDPDATSIENALDESAQLAPWHFYQSLKKDIPYEPALTPDASDGKTFEEVIGIAKEAYQSFIKSLSSVTVRNALPQISALIEREIADLRTPLVEYENALSLLQRPEISIRDIPRDLDAVFRKIALSYAEKRHYLKLLAHAFPDVVFGADF